MNSRPGPVGIPREVNCRSRRKYNPEEGIRIVSEGLKGEASTAELCRPLKLTIHHSSAVGGHSTHGAVVRRYLGSTAPSPMMPIPIIAFSPGAF